MHLLAATVWVGGTVALVFVAVPPVQRLQGEERGAHAARVRRALAADRLVVRSAIAIADRRRASPPARTRSTRRSTRFDWVLAVEGRCSSASSSPARTSTTSCSAPGSRARSGQGEPQSLRPILTAIGRANLLVTVALPILGVLLSEFLRD